MSKRTLVTIITLFLLFLLASCDSPEVETPTLVPSGEYEEVKIWIQKKEYIRVTVPDSDYLVGDFVSLFNPEELDADYKAVRKALKNIYIAQNTTDCKETNQWGYVCRRESYVVAIPPTDWLKENLVLEQYSLYTIYVQTHSLGNWALLYSEDECDNKQSNIVIDNKVYCVPGTFHSRSVVNAFLEECETLDCFQEILKRGLAFRFRDRQRFLFIVFPDDMSELITEDLDEDGYSSTLELQIWEFSSD